MRKNVIKGVFYSSIITLIIATIFVIIKLEDGSKISSSFSTNVVDRTLEKGNQIEFVYNEIPPKRLSPQMYYKVNEKEILAFIKEREEKERLRLEKIKREKELERIKEEKEVSSGGIRKTMEVTMYTANYESTGKTPEHPLYGVTASGNKVKSNYTIACSSGLDFGTEIYIPYFDNTYVCEDRGSAIKEGHLDIYVKNLDKALAFGRRDLEVIIYR